MSNDYQFHINGLKGIKPYLQSLMLTTNYEGMGETDAKEIGETIDLAIKALEMRMPKKPFCAGANPNYSPFDCSPDKVYICAACGGDVSGKLKHCHECGQAIDWSDVE